MPIGKPKIQIECCSEFTSAAKTGAASGVFLLLVEQLIGVALGDGHGSGPALGTRADCNSLS